MSENLEALEQQTHSVRGIRSVVHTMKTLSAINAAPCEHASQAINAYLDAIVTGLQALLYSSTTLQQLPRSNIEHRVILALGTDHGLCGNYNDKVATQVATEMATIDKRKASVTSHVVCVGAQLDDALVDIGIESDHVLFSSSTIDGLTRLAGELVEKIDNLTIGLAIESVHVQLVYTQPPKHGQLTTVVNDLLPMHENELVALRTRNWNSRSRPWFRQCELTLLSLLFRNYLFASICRAAVDALLSENRARLARMRQAEDAVDDQLAGLTMRSRAARQSRITENLQDVIAGFESLKNV